MRLPGLWLTALLVLVLSSGRATAAPHRTRTAAKTHHPRRYRARRRHRMSYGRYLGYVRRWHRRDKRRHAPLDAHGRPELVIESINTREQIALSPISDEGGFSASQLERAAHVLRDQRTGNEFPMDPGLLDILYRLQRHFKTHSIRVISAYRTPHPGSHSRHGQGRAIDLVVPGASDRAVARFVRDLGFCGVGVYPRSGFVHVDVRSRSYFWIDHSGPGRPNRARPTLRKLAKKVDRRALAAGCPRPRAGVRPDPDVDAVWSAGSVWPETRLASRLATRSPADQDQNEARPDDTAPGDSSTGETSADETSTDETSADETSADDRAAQEAARHQHGAR